MHRFIKESPSPFEEMNLKITNLFRRVDFPAFIVLQSQLVRVVFVRIFSTRSGHPAAADDPGGAATAAAAPPAPPFSPPARSADGFGVWVQATRNVLGPLTAPAASATGKDASGRRRVKSSGNLRPAAAAPMPGAATKRSQQLKLAES